MQDSLDPSRHLYSDFVHFVFVAIIADNGRHCVKSGAVRRAAFLVYFCYFLYDYDVLRRNVVNPFRRLAGSAHARTVGGLHKKMAPDINLDLVGIGVARRESKI